MGSRPSWLSRIARDPRRRSAWQALGIYLAAAWAVLQVVDQLVDRLSLPDWAYGFALLLLLLGLPVVLATSIVQARDHAPDIPGPDPGRMEGGEPGTVAHGPPAAASPSPAPSGRPIARRLTWRNAGLGGVGALALWGLIAALWLGLGPDRPAGASDGVGPTARLAVMPFTVRGSDDYRYLSEGLADLLSTRLDGAGDLRAVDSHALLSALGRNTPVPLSPATARTIADRFGAGLVVLGNVVEMRDRLRLTATFYDFAADGQEWEATAEGHAGELFELVDTLAAQILGGLGHGPGARVRRTAALTTASLPALKAYLQGDAALREGRFQEAYEAFTRAVAEDSSFALAHYRRSIGAEWTTRFDVAISAAETAMRHGARLSDRDRRQLEAFLAYRHGAFREAERLYRAIVGSYPDDVEAWNQLAETLFHYAPLHGRSSQEAREPYERVLAYETFRGAAIVHLARLAAAGRRHDELDSLVVAFLETAPEGDRELELLAMQAWAEDHPQRKREVLDRLALAPDQIRVFVIWDLAAYNHRPDGVIQVAGLLTGPDNPAEVRVYGHVIQAYALLGLGRWREAMARLDSAAAIDPAVALEHRAFLTLFPLLNPGRPELITLRDRLLRMDPGTIAPTGNPSGFFSVHDGMHPTIVAYLLGMVHARLGEDTAALRIADGLAQEPASIGLGTATSDFAWTIRAEAHRGAGRPADALAALERMSAEGWYSLMLASPFLARAHSRFLRAELLTELGRGEEALPWYAHLVEVAPNDALYLGAHHLRQAQILADLGRDDEAAPHFDRARAFWSDADPEFRAMLEAGTR